MLTFPESTIAADTVIDDLTSGLAIVAGTPQVITTAAASGGLLAANFNGTIGTQSITAVAGNGGSVQFDLTNVVVAADGNTTNNSILLRFRAVVVDDPANVSGVIHSNSATNQVGAGPLVSSNTVTVTVVEPQIAFSKTIVSLPTPADAGGLVQYRVTFTNNTGAASSTAFDVHITDTLPLGLTLNLPSTVTLVGGAAGLTDASTGNALDLTISSVPPGGAVFVDYAATIGGGVTGGQVIGNTANATWTSLSGSVAGERNYTAANSRSFTVASPSLTKLLVATSAANTAGANVTIGEEITYGLLLTFPEGMTPADTVIDDLTSGLAVVAGTPQVITTAAGSGGLLAADFNGTIGTQSITAVAGNGGSVQFDFTNVVVLGDNNTTNNSILLRVRAVVADDPANVSGTILSNTATNQVAAGPPVSSNIVTVTVVEPQIAFSKTIVSLPTPADAGGVVNYRVTFANNTGATSSTAFDVHITDTLPLGLTLNLPPTVTLGGGAAGLTDASTSNALDITVSSVPPGTAVSVDYVATIQGAIAPGQVTNTANATWTSLNGAVAGERSYAAVSSQSFTVAAPSLTKLLLTTSVPSTPGASVTIGEEITYVLLLTFAESTTTADTVIDDLTNGLAVVAGTPQVITTAAGSGGLLTADFNGTIGTQSITTVAGSGGRVQFNFTNLVVAGDNNTTNNSILLRFRAVVADVPASVSGAILSNTATNQVGAGPLVSSNTVTATVVEPIPLLTKAFTPATGTLGNTTRIRLIYQNSGTSNAYDVAITDDVNAAKFSGLTPITTPAGFTYSTSGTGPITVRYDAAAGFAVAPSASLIFEFDATLTSAIVPGETLSNTATVRTTTLDGPDPNERNATTSATASFAVIPFDLAIDKSHIGNFIVNMDGNFTIRVQNLSAGAATGTITVSDSLPAALRLQSVSGTGWTCTPFIGPPDSFTCTHPGPVLGLAALPDITAVVRSNTAAGSPFSNTASLTLAGTDTNPTNNTDSDSVVVITLIPDLAMAKTHVGNFTVGSIGSFILTVTNAGATPTSATIVVTDTLPPQLDFVSASGTGWTCSQAAGVVTCTQPGPLFPSASLPQIAVNVVPNAATGSPFTNAASVSTAGDTNASNDTATDAVAVNPGPSPHLDVQKTHSGNFTVGQAASFSIGVTNSGSASTVGPITVADALPPQLSFTSATGTGWTCSQAAGVVTCMHSGPLPIGASLPMITLTVVANTSVGSPFTNTATASTPGNSNPAASTGSDIVTVAAPDLSIAKSDGGTTTVPGGTVIYTLTYSNLGLLGSTGVRFTETVPANTAFLPGASTPGWICVPDNSAGSACTLNVGAVASGAGGTATFAVTVASSLPAGVTQVTNSAVIADDGANGPDSNPANNSSTATTTIVSSADLAVTKTGPPTPSVAPGSNITYTISVTNNGPSDASNVSLDDAVPANTTFVSESQTAGPAFTCSTPPGGGTGTTTCTIGTLLNGAGATLSIVVNVNAGAPAGTITNTANVTTATPDANAANNSASATTTVTTVPSTADAGIVKGANPAAVGPLGTITYTIVVANSGPASATGVTVTDNIPAGTSFLSAAPSQGTCAGTASVNCSLGTIASGGTASVTLTVTAPATSGVITNSATVSSSSSDPNAANNTSSVAVTVSAGIPLLDPEILALLAMAFAALGFCALRR